MSAGRGLGGARRAGPVASAADLTGYLLSGLALVPASANVVMQLSLHPVGRAVVESRVESGALTRHPLKRTRTTLTYLALTLVGTEEERRALARDVGRQHRSVHSDQDSPVGYDAFDPELQLWVAACLYRGALDVLRLYGVPLDEPLEADLLAQAQRFATTLQVPAGAWPTDPGAFAAYWESRLSDLALDPETRRYLEDLLDLRFVARPLSLVAGPVHRLVTISLLDPAFRDLLGVEVDRRVERAVRRSLGWLGRVWTRLPSALRAFPWNWVLADARRRLARGESLT